MSGGLCGRHWSPLQVHGFLAQWLLVGLGKGLPVTGHLFCVKPIRFLEETQSSASFRVIE